jgi:hypothetical protein
LKKLFAAFPVLVAGFLSNQLPAPCQEIFQKIPQKNSQLRAGRLYKLQPLLCQAKFINIFQSGFLTCAVCFTKDKLASCQAIF